MPTDSRAASVAALPIEHGLPMKGSAELMQRRMRVGLSLLLLAAISIAARARTATDFSGLWKQDNDRCQPKRNGNVTLRIEYRDPDLTVETSISRISASSRQAIQKYTTDGKVSISTGADGDEFHTSVVWQDASLVFSIEEHEDGRVLQSKERWSVIEDGATLERIRERPNGEKQTLFFRRIPAGSSDSKLGL